ncbi:Gfo/Idh/MocA family oxidoreductase [Paenibacillus sp. IB182496]|uniref:Gfo/Idh/MocA family oxidoreductase n=1 Tax=Paenibacillus sabuli TaxID=2772509 RepID=A0A927BR36_9BACL|nr:Gfo/Idh/MocA family oxidoreductase [Paenibacillus sabuli]MBD2843938.1 Gfo/Idh/MocA family oxidoreductase [Paenibacillus sabuli]
MGAVFSIVGGAGFRAQYFLRIAQALPERFRVGGMVVRDPAKGEAMEAQWGVKTYRTLERLLAAEQPEFVVLSVPPAASYAYMQELAQRGVPVLTETPPASDLDGLLQVHETLARSGARIQVAEQYPLYPAQAARQAVIDSGRLGRVSEVTVSISHLYHAVSLMRSTLGVRFENVTIRGMRFQSEWVAGPGRSGPPTEDRIVPCARDLAWLDFGDRLGIYDFTGGQHRSWTRSNSICIRGLRGEIFDQRIRLQGASCTELQLDLKRVNKGEYENAEGYFLKGFLVGEQWLYENPYAPARLYDDEIAIATCLGRMAAYAAGGPSFYGLPEASQDQYIGLLIEQAVQTGETIRSTRQPWADTQ